MKKRKLVLMLLLLSLILAACNKEPVVTETEVVSTATPTFAPTLTPTTVPPKVLNVCMAQEPQGLYRYDGFNNLAKQSLYAVLYPDFFSVDPQTQSPIFFESIPTPENGGIEVLDTQVKVGMPVQNAKGQVVYLSEGELIEYSLIETADNHVSWNHDQDYHMNQIKVTYRLRPGLLWSDGTPLTANDFVFSYHLAERAELGHDKWALDRTQSLVAQDELTLVWTGVPGFVPKALEPVFWKPMPEQALSGLSQEDLLTSDLTVRAPLSWGAYRLVGWDAGSQIQLEANPNYIGAGAVTGFDQVNFVIEPNLATAFEMLGSGSCDILDPTYQLEGLEKVELEAISAEADLVAENFYQIQHLVFGIQPASYDQGYNAWTATRQNILGNTATRLVMNACVNASEIFSTYMQNHLPQDTVMIDTMLMQTNTDVDADLAAIGWVYPDSANSGVRVAQSVPNVLDGTEFRLNLLSGQSRMDQEIAQMIKDALAQCGIAVDPQSLPVEQLYQAGPEGMLFGRNFDLALVSWRLNDAYDCQLYTSDQIPSSINSWVGTNLAGYSDAEFDRQCWSFAHWSRKIGTSPEDHNALMSAHNPAIDIMPHYRVWAIAPQFAVEDGFEFADIWLLSPVN